MTSCGGPGPPTSTPGENLGFAAAVNRGLRAPSPCRCSDVLLLNPDAVIAPDAVERLRRALHAGPAVACVAPAQHRPGSDVTSPVCWPFPTPARAWTEAIGLGRFARRLGLRHRLGAARARATPSSTWGGSTRGSSSTPRRRTGSAGPHAGAGRCRTAPRRRRSHVGAATDDDPDRREVRFHAGVETYVRKWHGSLGWHSYQAATVLTALRRAAVSEARSPARPRCAWPASTPSGPARQARARAMIPERPHHVPVLAGGPSGEGRRRDSACSRSTSCWWTARGTRTSGGHPRS